MGRREVPTFHSSGEGPLLGFDFDAGLVVVAFVGRGQVEKLG